MGYILLSIHYVTHYIIHSLSQLIQQSHDSGGVISIITILYMALFKRTLQLVLWKTEQCSECEQPYP